MPLGKWQDLFWLVLVCRHGYLHMKEEYGHQVTWGFKTELYIKPVNAELVEELLCLRGHRIGRGRQNV